MLTDQMVDGIVFPDSAWISRSGLRTERTVDWDIGTQLAFVEFFADL
jgi:hypothetical protein